ncbi:hypothetical protein H3146_17855 [Streptomyces sp. OF3]|uniref:Uncharacterized protein n=1 Tax=Streptomyces alkaliterrae TaxID=2213162 RepID=A0A7W3WMR0_9ACTN|nr:hypothetical protein [Streptomyces alkaliterrae]MBB1255203.1 hypothetical protein [Streptomyces alkaliterrae]
MANRTVAEQRLACSFERGTTRFEVTDLRIDYHVNRSATLVFTLAVVQLDRPVERWEVTLEWTDKSFIGEFTSAAPDPQRLGILVSLIRSLLEEWWETKGYERQSAKMGRRLP